MQFKPPRPQNREELAQLLKWASEAESILEIGSRYGDTLVDLAHAMKGKRLVSVDLPNVEGWHIPDVGNELQRNAKLLREEGFDVTLILADSHDEKTVEMVKALGPFDLVFIDGDHSYEGVKKDWLDYGPLGKRVVFHDIVKPIPGKNQALEVHKFWGEIKHLGTEFIAAGSPMGLGCLEQKNDK